MSPATGRRSPLTMICDVWGVARSTVYVAKDPAEVELLEPKRRGPKTERATRPWWKRSGRCSKKVIPGSAIRAASMPNPRSAPCTLSSASQQIRKRWSDYYLEVPRGLHGWLPFGLTGRLPWLGAGFAPILLHRAGQRRALATCARSHERFGWAPEPGPRRLVRRESTRTPRTPRTPRRGSGRGLRPGRRRPLRPRLRHRHRHRRGERDRDARGIRLHADERRRPFPLPGRRAWRPYASDRGVRVRRAEPGRLRGWGHDGGSAARRVAAPARRNRRRGRNPRLPWPRARPGAGLPPGGRPDPVARA